jgi:hypothetical protein
MLNVRRLVALTELRLMGSSNLVGDVTVNTLASNMPPDLAIVQLTCNTVSKACIICISSGWGCWSQKLHRVLLLSLGTL